MSRLFVDFFLIFPLLFFVWHVAGLLLLLPLPLAMRKYCFKFPHKSPSENESQRQWRNRRKITGRQMNLVLGRVGMETEMAMF